MNISESLRQGGTLHPDKPALIFEGRSITYSELDDAVSRVAGGLLNLGVAVGDRVALLLPNTPEMVICYFAVLRIGAVAVSLNPNLKSEEISFIFEDSRPVVAITNDTLRQKLPRETQVDLKHRLIVDGDDQHSPNLNELIRLSLSADTLEMAPDDPAAIVYTSGTTGFPKGAVLSHGNVISNIKAKKRYLNIQPEDRLLLFLPLFHCFGQNAVLNSGLYSCATIVLHRQFDLTRILRSIADDRVTMFFGVPATYIVLLEKASRDDMRPVRYYFSAASSLPRDVERRWAEKFGRIINQGYGLTETSPFASYNHLTSYKPGSIGTPIENVDMKIVSVDDGSDLAPGELGEIVIRGPNVMLGYWNRPTETAEAIRDGWFHTGDIGRMDAEGYFYIEDRVKDMINVGGLKVYPAEVENVLYRHPAVAEAAVYGVPAPVLGEQVRANIVLKTDCNTVEQEIKDFCRNQLADYKAPDVVEFVESIPKNPTGKVLKRVLREEASRAALTAASGDRPESGLRTAIITPGQIQEWVKVWIERHLEVDLQRTGLTKSFFDYGLSSSSAVKLAQDLGRRFGIWVEPTIAWSCPDVESLARKVADDISGVSRADELSAGEEMWNTLNELSMERRASQAEPELNSLSEAELAELLANEIATIKHGKS